MSDDLVAQLNDLNRCIRCGCGACVSGYENHEHICSGDKGCVAPLEPKLRKAIILAGRAAQTLTEARAEIERLRAKPPLLDAQSLPGVDALVKTLEAQLDEALRSCLAEREGRLKAQSELSTLRARVREVVGPFAIDAAKYDPDEGDSHEHAWGRLDLTIGHLRAARQLNEDLK